MARLTPGVRPKSSALRIKRGGMRWVPGKCWWAEMILRVCPSGCVRWKDGGQRGTRTPDTLGVSEVL